MITGRKTLWGWVAILALIVVAACAPVVETESEAAAYPARAMATTTLPPYPWPTQPPPPTDEPPPTEPPVPTLPPTPVVTPIPTAAPPIIPFPDGTAAQPFTLYWRDGDVIRSLRSEGQEEPSVFLDPVKEFGLYLPPEDIYMILVAETANQGSRPITSGPINQTYLWTAETIIGGNTFLPQGALICLGLVPAIGLAACWLPTEGRRG